MKPHQYDVIKRPMFSLATVNEKLCTWTIHSPVLPPGHSILSPLSDHVSLLKFHRNELYLVMSENHGSGEDHDLNLTVLCFMVPALCPLLYCCFSQCGCPIPAKEEELATQQWLYSLKDNPEASGPFKAQDKSWESKPDFPFPLATSHGLKAGPS